MSDPGKIPLPRPTPETRHFWEGAKQNKLLLQKCNACSAVYFPPRPFCPECQKREVSLVEASGKAILYSYVINHRPHPGFDSPYAIAAVKLEEGPVLMSNIVDIEQTPESLVLDMPLEVVFRKMNGDITLPYFRPAHSPGGRKE